MIENTGTETVDLDAVTLGGSDPGEFTSARRPGHRLHGRDVAGPGQTCDVRVEFDPSTVGSKAADVTRREQRFDDVIVTLDGDGTQTELTADLTSLSFGDQDIDDGATATQTSVIQNTGTEAVDLDAVTLGGAEPGDFDVLDDEGTDCTDATVLIPFEACNVRVVFDPGTVGSKTADVTIDEQRRRRRHRPRRRGHADRADRRPDEPRPRVAGHRRRGRRHADVGHREHGHGDRRPRRDHYGGADPGDFTALDDQGTDCTPATTLTAGADVRPAHRVRSDGHRCQVRDGDRREQRARHHRRTSRAPAPRPSSPPRRTRCRSAGRTSTTARPPSQTSTVENTGTEQVSLSVTEDGDTGHFERFTDQGTDCTGLTTLNAGDTCEVRVRFDPASQGAKTATYTLESQAPDEVVTATGTGTFRDLTASPATVPFGYHDVDAGPDRAAAVERRELRHRPGDDRVGHARREQPGPVPAPHRRRRRLRPAARSSPRARTARCA